jgi:predicted ArsR family transcriptional regulator
VLALLAIAADRHGASFYGRDKMALQLGLERHAVDRALDRLKRLGLVEHRPWSPGHPDGVWQLLPLPAAQSVERGGPPASIGDLLRRIGDPGARR